VRVLHLIYDDRGNPWVAGGGAVRAFEIYRRLAGRVDATIVTGRYPGCREGDQDGVRFRRAGARWPYPWSRLTYGLAANHLVRGSGYDAAVFDYSAYTPIFLPRNRPVGLAVHHLTGPTARARWGRVLGSGVSALERAMLGRARWASLSARTIEPDLRPMLAPGAEVMLVGAGVAEEFFRLEREDRGFLLFFGRLDLFQKGLDTLVDAYRLLREDRPGLRLRIAGRGKDGAALERLLVDAGVADGVEILGAVSDGVRLELLRTASIMLMPSRFEGFGLVAAEAMAAGVPLVASDAGSLPEVIDPPVGGVTVPAGDAGALAEAVGQLLATPSRRADMSRSARESARRFSWQSVAERHYLFLERISASSHP
jgi:glycosyltransferase involved in cell wall biosynthesis